jgi:uncharacterized DUF497 family protein
MKLTISIHAKGRALKWGISEEGVKSVLSQSPAVSVPSKTDPEAIVVFGKHEAKTWGVVLNVNTFNVITIRPASKKERRFYEQKTGN